MAAVVNAQSLVLGADEDGAEQVSSHEEEEETVVHVGVLVGVED